MDWLPLLSIPFPTAYAQTISPAFEVSFTAASEVRPDMAKDLVATNWLE